MGVDEKWNISLKNCCEEIGRNGSISNTPSISTEYQAFVLILLEVLIVVGNILTMLTVWRVRKYPLVVDVLIFSLSLADVLNALISVTIAILMRFLIVRGQEIPWLICQVQGWCIVAFEMTSVFIISLVCFDRFTAIVKPFWHHKYLTCARTVKAVAFVTAFSFLVASLPLLGWDSYRPVNWLAMCLFNYRSSYAIFIALFGYFQLFFVMFSAVAIVYSLRKFANRKRRLTARYSQKHRVRHTEFMPMKRTRTHTERQTRQLAKIGMIVVMFFYMSWLPLVLCITIQQISDIDVSKMVFLASFLSLSSPVANPWIYFLMWKRYRRAFIQMTGTVKCRHPCFKKNVLTGESKAEDQPRKRIRPTSLAIIPLSSAADNCYESPSSSFVFTDLRYHASHTKFDLTQRKTEEEWNIHDLDGCRVALCYEANCSMHHFGRTDITDSTLTIVETYV